MTALKGALSQGTKAAKDYTPHMMGAQLAGSLLSSATGLYTAHKQMKFQREMSGSAHQREVKDLKKAGLNPILSAMGGSGASSPGGAMMTPENPTRGMTENMIANKMAKMTIAKQNEEIKTQISQQEVNSAMAGKLLEESAGANEDWQNLDVFFRADIRLS